MEAVSSFTFILTFVTIYSTIHANLYLY